MLHLFYGREWILFLTQEHNLKYSNSLNHTLFSTKTIDLHIFCDFLHCIFCSKTSRSSEYAYNMYKHFNDLAASTPWGNPRWHLFRPKWSIYDYFQSWLHYLKAMKWWEPLEIWTSIKKAGNLYSQQYSGAEMLTTCF